MADSVCKDYIRMVKLIKKRDAAFDKNKRNFKVLRRANVFTEADVRNFCLESSQTIRETICWNSENESLVKRLVLTFNYFSWMMRQSSQVILWDSRMEQNRYQLINNHISRNRMRSKDATYKNTRIVNALNTKLYEYRRKFERKKSI